MTRLPGALVVALSLAACGAETPAPDPAPDPSPPPAASGPVWSYVEISELGLKAEVPGDGMTAGAGSLIAVVGDGCGASFGTRAVLPALPSREAQVHELEASDAHGSFVEFVANEDTTDGWAVVAKFSKHTMVVVRRKVGALDYLCKGIGETPQMLECARRVCSTAKPI